MTLTRRDCFVTALLASFFPREIYSHRRSVYRGLFVPKKKQKKQDDNITDLLQSRELDRSILRARPRFSLAAKKDRMALQRQGSEDDEDQFIGVYGTHDLLVPPYDIDRLWLTFEQSDVLWSNIHALVANCERPNDLEFTGDDTTQKDLPEAKEEQTALRDFFSAVNENESMLRLRSKTRLDREVSGNAFWEVLRDVKGRVERIYYIPSTKMRVTKIETEPIQVTHSLPRNGKIIRLPVPRRFRRFARWFATGKIVWFKEFGDPRPMEATTGEYVDNPKNPATEIWWFRDAIAGGVYGVPRWVSTFLDIRGRRLASWVNFDTLDQGAIPPLMLLAQGGRFSRETLEELQQVLDDWRNPAAYNRPMLLSLEPDIFGLDANAKTGKSAPRIEVEKLRNDRSEDYMFAKYLKYTEESVGSVFRIPAVIRGAAENYNYASAYVPRCQVCRLGDFSKYGHWPGACRSL